GAGLRSTTATNGPVPPANGSSGTGALVSQNFSVNLGQNVSGLTGVATAPAVALPPTSVAGTTHTGNPGFAGGVGTNGLPLVTSAQTGIRGLIVLQSDIERSLQLMAGLNGAVALAGSTNGAGSFSNSFNPLGNQSGLFY